MSLRVLCPGCPLCNSFPFLVLGGGSQAFCMTDDCPVFTWNPLMADGGLSHAHFISPEQAATDHAGAYSGPRLPGQDGHEDRRN